jgi:hypothetical protein
MNLNDPELRAEVEDIKEEFDGAPQRARDRRDQRLRELAAKYDLRQVDLVTVTGYSRETVRQALNPTNRDVIRARRRVDPSQELAYLAARTHLNPLGWGEEVTERVARDIAARVTDGEPYDDDALGRVADVVAVNVPGDGLKRIPVLDALKAAQEASRA